MSKHMLSADEVLNRIGAVDFRSISKKQLIEFASSIPEMDKETAIKCIEQFPEFAAQSKEIINHFYEICSQAIEDDKTTRKDAIESYRLVLDDLREQLKSENISESLKMQIIDRMVDVADKIAETANGHSAFVHRIMCIAVGLAATALTIGGTILGAKVINGKKE